MLDETRDLINDYVASYHAVQETKLFTSILLSPIGRRELTKVIKEVRRKLLQTHSNPRLIVENAERLLKNVS